MYSSPLLLFLAVLCASTATVNFLYITPAYAAGSTESTTSNEVEGSLMNTTLTALLAFKQAISLDPTSYLALWNASTTPDYCTWPGVRCSSDGTHQVIALLLESNNLTGTLPPQLKEFSNLSYLNVSNNNFYGPIPPELGELSSLTHLDLSVNKLTGPVPSSLENCTLLQFIDLGANSLSASSFPSFLVSLSHLVFLGLSYNNFAGGELPLDIGRLSNLQFLQLHGCRLAGSLPPSITNCSTLVWLDLSGNGLTGPLPPDWSKLASSEVEQILLQDNLFTGSIPSTLGNCTTLSWLGLSNNSLTGELPESLGKLAMLEYLAVFDNRINGQIPTSLVNCSSLLSLQLGHNNLTGSIPTDIGQLMQLESLSFTNNAELSGFIPDTIGNCAQLQLLGIRFTGVGGPLPMSIYNLSNLQTLRLSSSRFSGNLSVKVRNMTALTSLALDWNSFQGQIPAGLGELADIQGLDLQHNQFVGPIFAHLYNWSSILISEMDLSHNMLTGDIPAPVLGHLQLLNNLFLQHNSLSGNIPDVFGSLSRVQNLDLSHNMLTGKIPPSLSVSESLDLSFNNLTGTIPASMGSMGMVTTIRLAYNHFTGEIPGSLSGCVGLQVLDLSVNNLEGEIPSGLGGLRVLQYLNLSQNKLSGALPPSLGALPSLISLNVSFNALQGMIPSGGIFKNLSAASLQGNPGLCGYPLSTSCTSAARSADVGRSRSTRRILIVSVCSVGGGILVFVAVCACLARHRWMFARLNKTNINIVDDFDEEWCDVQKTHELRAWTAKELREATNGFDTANLIGSGGLSACYKGSVVVEGPAGSKKLDVAIKRLDTRSMNLGREAKRSLVQELKTLCQVRHRNLVKPLGYCMDEGELALVMEFMEMGNLDEHLHSGSGATSHDLSWEKRLSIATDVAEGLAYLHHESIQPIIHCDLKPGNILLSSEMVAKISDFGIARLLDYNGAADQLISISCSNFRGTFGYAPPECASGSRISTKADVYSYGVLLIELVTGMRPTSPYLQELGGITLRTWASRLITNSRDATALESSLLDSAVQEAIKKDPSILQQLEELLDLGVKCSNDIAKERPNMKAVRDTLIKLTNKHKSFRRGVMKSH